MHAVRLAAVMVAVVLAVSGPRPCQGQWEALLPALTTQLSDLWQNNALEFMGSTCYYSQRPTFRRWQLYFDGDFSCPTWTNIKGTYRTRSRTNVLTKTIEDFLNKVRAAGLVTDEEANEWLQLQGHN